MNNLVKEFWFLPPLSIRDQPSEGGQGVLKGLINFTQIKGFAITTMHWRYKDKFGTTLAVNKFAF